MRISDWSSDVCSSDLRRQGAKRGRVAAERQHARARMEIEHTRSPLKAPIGGGNQLEFLRKVPVGQFCVGSRQRGCDSHDVEPGLASSLAIRGDGRKFGEAEIVIDLRADAASPSAIILRNAAAIVVTAEIGRAQGRERVCTYV